MIELPRLIGAIGVGSLVLLFGFGLEFHRGTCPSCRRRFAFKKTGETRTKPALLFSTYSEYEEACKRCGHVRWKMEVWA